MPNVGEPDSPPTRITGDDENGDAQEARVSEEGFIEAKSNDLVLRELESTSVTQEIQGGTVINAASIEVAPGEAKKVVQATGDIANQIDTPQLLNTNTTNNTGASSVSTSFNLTSGDSRIILVGVSFSDTTDNTVQSVTYGGKELTPIRNGLRADSPPNQYVEVQGFALVEDQLPSDGSNTLKVTMESSVSSLVAAIAVYENVEQRQPENVVEQTIPQGEASSISTDIPVTSLETFVIDVYADTGGSSAVATGNNQDIVAQDSANHSLADSLVVTDTDVTFSYDTGDGTNEAQAHAVATFLPERGNVIPDVTRGFQVVQTRPEQGTEELLVKDLSAAGDSPNLAKNVVVDNTDGDNPVEINLQLFHNGSNPQLMTGTLVTQDIE